MACLITLAWFFIKVNMPMKSPASVRFFISSCRIAW